MDKKFVIVGVGNCGSQIANLAVSKYPELFESICINSSESDLAMVTAVKDELKFKVGNRNEIEGAGKNRSKMKEYLQADIRGILNNQNLRDLIASQKYCFVAASTAGGTGSGAAPVLFDVLRQMFPDTYFILIGVLPKMNVSIMEQENTIEFLNELYQTLGADNTTYMLYDNESAANLPPTTALTTVNENIVEDLRILTGVDNYPTPYESIDEGDFEQLMTTPGRLLITRVKSGLTVKNLERDIDEGENTKIDDIVIKAIKNSSNVETDRNEEIAYMGVITYFTDEVNNLYNTNFTKLQNFIGHISQTFNHNAINNQSEDLNFLYLVASGLAPINDRVKRITEKIDKMKAEREKANANKYILAGDDSYSTDNDRKNGNQVDKNNPVNPEDIFKKFMK